MAELHVDNSTYIDTPFTLQLKRELRQAQEKTNQYRKVCTKLKGIIAHRDEVISLRDITIRRLKGELDTITEREDSRLRQQAYNTFGNEPININIY